MLGARLKEATPAERQDFYRKQLKAIEKAARGTDFQHAGVREKLAVAWAELGDQERAIGHYRAALSFEDADLSLHALEQLANLEIRHGATLLEYKDTDEKIEREQRDKGQALMKAGHKRLEQLIKLGETTERLSLLGSYWKRWAQAHTAQGETGGLKEWLAGMENAFWKAAKHSNKRTGSWDYYPLLNALDAAFLRAAWGEREPLDKLAGHLPDLLRAAAENGRRRFAEQRELCHALAEVEAERIDALWACLDETRQQASLTEPEVFNRLASQYRLVLNRLGDDSDQDPATHQLRFVIALLPEDKPSRTMKEALQRLVEKIMRSR
jgi:hypothetical protein